MSKVAVVTGASRGIGRAIAERLGAAGMRVVVNYRTSEAAAAEVVAAVHASGGQATAVRADAHHPDGLRGLFDTAERVYGGLDVVVGNVGAARFGRLADATDADFDEVFVANARATFGTLREAARRVRDGGRIVVVSSGATVTARPATGLYAASKAAGDQLVRTAAKELGPRGITVNSVLPGATRTDALTATAPADQLAATRAQTPLGRLGEPGDIAAAVAFLVSDDGAWITGQTLHAGGGLF